MHLLRDVLDCQDPTCRCNDWLALQRPIPAKRVRFVHTVGPHTKAVVPDLKHGTCNTYNRGCRCVACTVATKEYRRVQRANKQLRLA